MTAAAADAEQAFWSAHKAACDHVKAVDVTGCGCRPHRLCPRGQALDNWAEELGRRWGRVTGGWV